MDLMMACGKGERRMRGRGPCAATGCRRRRFRFRRPCECCRPCDRWLPRPRNHPMVPRIEWDFQSWGVVIGQVIQIPCGEFDCVENLGVAVQRQRLPDKAGADSHHRKIGFPDPSSLGWNKSCPAGRSHIEGAADVKGPGQGHRDAFNGPDLGVLRQGGQSTAGQHGLAIHQHGACTAISLSQPCLVPVSPSL